MKSAPQCGSGKSRSTTVRNYTLLCICKSSKQTDNLPGGMWQAGNTVGNVDRADRKPRCGAELTKRQDVKPPGIRGRENDRNTAPEYFGLMASHTGRCEGAIAEKAVPFPSDCPSILLHWQINRGASS